MIVARQVGASVLVPLVALAFVGATAAGPTQPSPSLLAPISTKRLAHCERSALLRPICPRSVPQVDFYLSHLSPGLRGLRGPVLDVFGMEHGGEDRLRPRRNRPPRMAHVVVVAGDIGGLAPSSVPRGDRREPLRDGVMRRAREAAVSFGTVRWAGRDGILSLAPSFPAGGLLGNHLNFTWRQHGRSHTLSLHAWEPLTEAASTLRTMVERMPSLAEADRLRRLSPTRQLTMPAGRATVRARIPAPTPGRHAFRAYVVMPQRAKVDLRVEGASGRRLQLLDPTTRPDRCEARRPLRLCFVRVPKASAPAGGMWTLVLTKRSKPPGVVRVDVVFRSGWS